MNLSSMMYRMNVQNSSASGTPTTAGNNSHSGPGTSHIIIQQHPGHSSSTHVITGNVNHHPSHKWNGSHNMGLPGGSSTSSGSNSTVNNSNSSASINDVKIITAIKAEPIQEVITITATNTNNSRGGGNGAVANLSASAAGGAGVVGASSSAGSSSSSAAINNNTNSAINAPNEHMLFVTKRARMDG